MLLDEFRDYNERISAASKTDCVEIKLNLKSPVAFMGYLTFDGFLSRLVWEDVLKDKAWNMPELRDDIYETPLPLFEVGESKRFYCCSFAQYQGNEEKTCWQKLENSPLDADIDRSQRRSAWAEDTRYRMPLVLVNAPELIFYAMGDAMEIERLLSTATQIGKKASQGYGVINKIRVSSVTANRVIKDNDGGLLRTIPIDELKCIGTYSITTKLGLSGFRPPYWHPLNQTNCFLPREKYV